MRASMTSTRELFVHSLTDILDAEKKINTAMSRLVKKVSNESLAELMKQHQQETEGQIQRLEEVFANLEEKPKRKTCEGMAGLLAEAQEFFKTEKPDDAVSDLFLSDCARKIEHYEISEYQDLIEMARHLDLNECVGPLEETLREEREMLEKLHDLGRELLAQMPAEEEQEEELEMAGGSAKRSRSR